MNMVLLLAMREVHLDRDGTPTEHDAPVAQSELRIRSCAAWPTRRAGKVFVYHPTARQVWCGN